MPEFKVLVIKRLSVDGLSSGSIVSGEISALAHELVAGTGKFDFDEIDGEII